MPNRSCPSCLRRLPYAGRRCIHCGWTHGEAADDPIASAKPRRRQLVWGAVLLLFLAGGGGLVARNAPTLADWYAGFAAERLAQPFSSFAPVATDASAFFYCARQVARQMKGDFSIETFPAPDQSTTHTLGEDRYRIVSFVDQALESGERVRHDFVCTVRHDRGRWVLEDLEMQRYAGAAATAAGSLGVGLR
jgi:hypothetical protein